MKELSGNIQLLCKVMDRPNGSIMGYTVKVMNTDEQLDIASYRIKRFVRRKEVTLLNAKLTSDNRIVMLNKNSKLSIKYLNNKNKEKSEV